jgi:hypothetical protein
MARFAGAQARVKRRGKSPPRWWQHQRHGKPQREQGQIGSEGRPAPIKTLRVGCSRTWVTTFPEE